MQPCDKLCTVLASLPCPVSSSSSSASSSTMAIRSCSAFERMQSKFRAKLAKIHHIEHDCHKEESHTSPQQGKMRVATLEANTMNTQVSSSSSAVQRAGGEAEAKQSPNQPCEVNWATAKKPPRPGVRVAGVKWGTRDSKKMKLH